MEETFWPIPPGPESQSRAELYRGYKRLINNISEKLHKGEILSLAYQHDLPAWFVEVGPMHEPGYALRVLSQMEGRQIFSPTNLKDLATSMESIGRMDLFNMVTTFEEQHREIMETISSQPAVVTSSLTPEPYLKEEQRRMSLGNSGTVNNRRYFQDTFREERKHSQSSLDMQMNVTTNPYACINRPVSAENRSRHGSTDKFSMDRSREGTPFETVLDNNIDAPLPQDINLGIEMSKMSAETLGNQLQLVQQMMANHCLNGSPSAHHSLTNAYLLTKQITSLLNIASDSIKMVPMTTRYPGNYGGMENEPSPMYGRHNSYGDITKHTSQGSLNGNAQAMTNTWDQSDIQRDGVSGIYRTNSQPQVFHLSSTESSSQGEKTSTGNQFSPLEFTDVAFGDTTTAIVRTSIDQCDDNVPPPLPPRPANMPTKDSTCIVRPIRVSPHCFKPLDSSSQEEVLSPITRHGYHLMRPSKSVQDLNKLNESNQTDRVSKSLTRSRESSYSGRGFKLFGKKKISSGTCA